MGHKWPSIHTHIAVHNKLIEWPVQTFIANCRKDICINLTKPKVFHVGKQTNDNLTTHKCTGHQASSRRWAAARSPWAWHVQFASQSSRPPSTPNPAPEKPPTHSYNMIQFASCTNFSRSLNYQFIIDFPQQFCKRTLLKRLNWPKCFRSPMRSIIRKPFDVK